tara:strand:- start:487 stop:834 length:348 start_codon:yes stop_codon:yes gene_type:complete
MDNPAKAARRILLGTGVGLFLVSFMALREGRLPLYSNIGWSIPIAAIVAIVIGFMIPQQPDSKKRLARWFPALDESSIGEDIKNVVSSEEEDGDVGGAWAKLEEAMLSSELEESE